ncbi:RagB/SusD family nutrient uptake outer membrane protein [Chitinophaga sp. YIM B06452]|uniref:RagB/SusD family nutrient uptake outer membrane protein n=1 Tax=Chitinophaga sp. YIM B06452 TaxID=3082158 RepID=UPI0031FE751E
MTFFDIKNSVRAGFYAAGLWLLATGCDKKLDGLTPHNVNFESQQFASPEGFTKATIGNYTGLYAVENHWFNISEFRGNNVRFIDQTSTSNLVDAQNFDAFTFTNTESKDFGLTHQFWQTSYQALLGVNMVLRNVKDEETNPVILQAKAENLFLRAFINFNLVRVYGRPYYQSPETNPGIPLILQPITGTDNPPARATVREIYDQIIADLKASIPLFSQKKVNSFANKYASFALLSRVYLYMSGTFDAPATDYARLSEQYADSVILNGGYTLLQGAAYANYYKSSNQANAETIWALNHDAATTTLPMLLNQPAGVYAGHPSYSTGQVKPSPALLDLLAANDLRWNFYIVDKYRNNTTDTLSTSKYYYKYVDVGVYYSNAPFNHFRLAEMYLNRAEARVKQGRNDDALTDLNAIHTRAGLTGLNGLAGQPLFAAILRERRLELAFEGHIGYDYFRNGLPMVRNYSSFNSAPLTINPDDPRVVMRISLDVLVENPNVKQNVQ